jgi:hypothetical protein
MHRAVLVAWLLGLLGTMPLSAQEAVFQYSMAPADTESGQPGPVTCADPAPEMPTSAPAEIAPAPTQPWQTAWGLVALRAIPAGPKVAPNGERYHPNFTLDLNINFWLWRSQRLYLYGDMSLWGEKDEYGVTNGRDGWLGTSKRQFDLWGGAAWNYAGPWEARVFGYTDNNLNRGTNLVTPYGFTDGFGLENRYYLSPEYAKLGQTGFDIARATFLSIGYFPSKDMVGNDGKEFAPGPMLGAYLIYDLWNWPVYAFGDATFIGERSFEPKLLLFDVGLAARPFAAWNQWEFRLGVANTADLQVHNVLNLWYLSFRYIF